MDRVIGIVVVVVVDKCVVKVEEVPFESDRYFGKLFGVDAVTFENLVNVGSFAVDFLCKPFYGSLLFVEFFSYFFSNMYHKKGDELFFCSYLSDSPAKNCKQYKHRTVHAV